MGNFNIGFEPMFSDAVDSISHIEPFSAVPKDTALKNHTASVILPQSRVTVENLKSIILQTYK